MSVNLVYFRDENHKILNGGQARTYKGPTHFFKNDTDRRNQPRQIMPCKQLLSNKVILGYQTDKYGSTVNNGFQIQFQCVSVEKKNRVPIVISVSRSTDHWSCKFATTLMVRSRKTPE